MDRPTRRSLVSALALVLAGAAAFAIFARHGDPTDEPSTHARGEAQPAVRATGGSEFLVFPHGHFRASMNRAAPAGEADGLASPGRPAAGPEAEDWRVSPRLWLFSGEDLALVRSLLEAFDAAERAYQWQEMQRLTKRFRELGARAVAPLLDVLLRDPDDRMRIFAASILGEIQDSVPGGLLRDALRAHALPFLEDAASSAKDAAVRHHAIVALGKIGDPSCFDFLVDNLRRSEGWPFERDAIEALGSIQGAQVTGEIADLAEGEWDPRVRERLVRAMGEREDPAGLGTLEDIATRDTDPAVRAAAAEALGRLGTPAAARALRGIADGQDEPEVRVAAVESLGRPEDPGAVPYLRRVLRSDDDPEVRSGAWRALREMGTPEARQAIAPYPPAVRVDGVVPGSQAERLSLAANDVITSYDGKPVKDAGTLRELVLSTPPDQVVPLVVDNNGWTRTVFVYGGLIGVRVQDGPVLD